MTLKLTSYETEKLEKEGTVYAIRGLTVYLVEQEDDSKLVVTIINASVKVIKTYQRELF